MTDIEFQVLMGLKKVFAIDGCRLPNNGENATYDLISPGSNEKFLFDIDSPPHMNPDGTIVSSTSNIN